MLKLKYLFHCEFNDGEIFSQNAEDRSVIDPEKRSSFFDLLQDTREVERFWLEEADDKFLSITKPNTYLVDLTDGHFEVNGSSFFLHEQTIDPLKKLSKFRLIYFRRNTVSLNLATGEQSALTMIFIIGWQANHPDGRNVKRTMMVT